MIIIQLIMAFIGTLSFAILFNIPKSEYLFSGLTGVIGWGSFLLFRSLLSSGVYATLIASLIITLVSRLFAVNRKLPVTVFLLSGIFPLVPGAGIYYTAYYIFSNDLKEAGGKGIEAISSALAIAFGIIIISMIPQKYFIWRQNKEEAN